MTLINFQADDMLKGKIEETATILGSKSAAIRLLIELGYDYLINCRARLRKENLEYIEKHMTMFPKQTDQEDHPHYR